MTKKLFTYYRNKKNYIKNRQCLFDRLGVVYNSSMSDRFNYLNQFSKWNFETFEDRLPSINETLDYTSICMERGRQLIEQYPEGIAIAYSGGVDSTGILAILILLGYPAHQIRLVGNKYSLLENNFVLDFCNKNNVKLTIADSGVFCQHFHNLPEQVIVFGGCNDQFFHVGSVYKNVDKQLIPIEDGFRWLYSQNNLDKYFEHDLELMFNYSQLVGWEVKDLFDLSVLLNFGCRYTFIQNHLALQTPDTETQQKTINFYDNQDYQDWALTYRLTNKEHYKLSLQSNLYYKPELKKIIHQVFKNDDFLYNKGKEGSWIKIMKDQQERVHIPAIMSVIDKDGPNVKWYTTEQANDLSYRNHQADFFNDYLKTPFKI